VPGYDAEFLALKVMKAWRLDPERWRALDVDDRAMMMAFELFEGTCDSYRDQFSREYHEKKNAKPERGGANEFTAMKRELGMK